MTDDSPKSKTDDSWGDTYMLSTNEEAEFMSYLDKIPPEERAVLLKNLRSQGVRTRFAPEFAAAVSKEDEDGDEDDVKPPAMVSDPPRPSTMFVQVKSHCVVALSFKMW